MSLLVDQEVYTMLYNWIDGLHHKNSYDEIRIRGLEMLEHLPTLLDISEDKLTEEIFNQIINELIEVEENSKINSLDAGTYNSVIEVPKVANSTWQRYKQKLKNDNWSTKSIQNIEDSSLKTLRYLSQDTTEMSPVKGLAVGNVQSGKTANMTGLMAMAGDYGFNFFIVLSGVIEKLREQTSRRIKKDLAYYGDSNLQWNELEKVNLSENKDGISHFDLSDGSTQKFFTVTLKNKSRLESLFKWLLYDKNKAKQLKILVIDDEADQASVNTNKINEQERTTINKLITDFVNEAEVKAMNYIAYTATPYANVLNDNSDESLYPKDFIVLLNSGEDYIGPTEIFGLEDPESSPKVDIARTISDKDAEIIKGIQKYGFNYEVPQSLKDAINWFLISVSAMRTLNYKNPITMLVHTSFRKEDHKKIAEKIVDHLDDLKKNYDFFKQGLMSFYETEKKSMTKGDFSQSMSDYASKDKIPDYPEWDEIENQLLKILDLPQSDYYSYINTDEEGVPKYGRGIHVSIDNSDNNQIIENEIKRLVYPTENQMPDVAPAFIVIGGNTLSRGLTLEGLVSSYFLRNTKQADTLMQMGRWFGYRQGYEIFPRVWLDYPALDRFEFITQMDEEFRNEIKQYDEISLTPLEYAPRVKNSPNNNLIRITSANKSQAAIGVQFNFTGFNSQTIYFEENKNTLEENLQNTADFLNNLEEPDIRNKSRMVWENVELDYVLSFFEKYHVSRYDRKMSLLPELIDWLRKNAQETGGYPFDDWSVILGSKGDIRTTKNKSVNGWNIHGYSPQAITRRKKRNQGIDGVANIGVLRTPSDLIVDINADLSSEDKNNVKNEKIFSIRKKYGYGNTPQLIIYKIDKGNPLNDTSDWKEGGKIPLDFPLDVIGINVMIPGFSNEKSITEFISVPSQRDLADRLIEEEEEDK